MLFPSQIFACPVRDAPPPLLTPHFGVRLEGDSSQKRSKSLSLIGPSRVDVATCCDENQIFRQEVDAALVSSVEKKLSAGSCVGNVMWGWTLSALCVSFCVRVLPLSHREFEVGAAVLLHIWLSALINCVLCIF